MCATIAPDYYILNYYVSNILNDDTRIIASVDQGGTDDDRWPLLQVNGRQSFHEISPCDVITEIYNSSFDYHGERQNPVGCLAGGARSDRSFVRGSAAGSDAIEFSEERHGLHVTQVEAYVRQTTLGTSEEISAGN
jgi:hypothetical protein